MAVAMTIVSIVLFPSFLDKPYGYQLRRSNHLTRRIHIRTLCDVALYLCSLSSKPIKAIIMYAGHQLQTDRHVQKISVQNRTSLSRDDRASPLAAAEHLFDVGFGQLQYSRPAVAAGRRARGGLHLAQQRAHLRLAQFASGTDAAVAGEAGNDGVKPRGQSRLLVHVGKLVGK